jgi:hypothetical protein
VLGGWAVAGLSSGGDHVSGCFGKCVRRFGRGLLCHFGGEHLDRDGGLNPMAPYDGQESGEVEVAIPRW